LSRRWQSQRRAKTARSLTVTLDEDLARRLFVDAEDLRNREIKRLADLLSSLPHVGTSEDVEKVPEDAEGIYAERLDDEILLAAARRIPSIRYIACSGNNRVTDAGLSALQHFTQLEWLDLEWSQITDAGLPVIASVSTLKTLDVGNSSVTVTGVEHLKVQRPDLDLL
jgi:hypothetical protein